MPEPELLTEDEAVLLLKTVGVVTGELSRFGLDVVLSKDEREQCRFIMERLALTLKATSSGNYKFDLNLVLKQTKLSRKNLGALSRWWWEMKNDRVDELAKAWK